MKARLWVSQRILYINPALSDPGVKENITAATFKNLPLVRGKIAQWAIYILWHSEMQFLKPFN